MSDDVNMAHLRVKDRLLKKTAQSEKALFCYFTKFVTSQWLKIDLYAAECRLLLLAKTDPPCSAVSLR